MLKPSTYKLNSLGLLTLTIAILSALHMLTN